MSYARYRCGATCTTGYATGRPCRRPVAIEGSRCPHHTHVATGVEKIGHKRYTVGDVNKPHLEVAEEYGRIRIYSISESGVHYSLQFEPELVVGLGRALRAVQTGR